MVLIIVTAGLGVSVIVGRRVFVGISVGAIVAVGAIVSVGVSDGVIVSVGGIGVEVSATMTGIAVHEDRIRAVAVKSGRVDVGVAAFGWQAVMAVNRSSATGSVRGWSGIRENSIRLKGFGQPMG